MAEDLVNAVAAPDATLGRRLRTYVAIPTALLLFSSGFYLIRNTLPNYLDAKGLGYLAGPMQAVLPATSLLLAIPAGLLADRFSPRKLAIAGLAMFCLFAALVFLAGDDPPPAVALIGAYFLCGVSSVMINNTVRPLYLKCIGHARQHVKLALFQGITMLGFGLGPFVSGLAFRWQNWPIEWQFRLALPFGLLGLATGALMSDSSPVPFSLAAYRQIVVRRTVLVYLVMIFVNALHFGVEAVTVSRFCKQGLGLDDWGVGVYFGSVSVVLALTAVGTMWLREHATNRHRMWVWGLTGSALFNVAVAFATRPWEFFLLRYGHVLADALMLVAGLQIVGVLFPRSRVGGPIGLISVVQTSGILVGSLLAGAINQWVSLGDHWRLALPFVVVGVLVLASVVMQLAMRERF